MNAELSEKINLLPVILKAHIYEPRLERVVEISYGMGIKEVVDWGNETCPHDIFGEGTQCYKHACDICWQELKARYKEGR